MDWFEICIVVLCAVIVLICLICPVGFCMLARRYKKFYETTADGKIQETDPKHLTNAE